MGGKPGPIFTNPDEREEHLVKVAELLKKGMSYRQIAAERGCSFQNIARDAGIIRARWRKAMIEDFDELQQAELGRLDWLEEQAIEGWIRSLQDGEKIVERLPRGEDEQADANPKTGFLKERTSYAQSGDPRFLEQIRKYSEDRRKILGLDAPVKVAPTDPTGTKEFSGATPDELLARLEQIRAARSAITGRAGSGDTSAT